MPIQLKYSEPDLVIMLKSKEEKAFNYLYDNYAGALLGVIKKIISVEETAVDVLQEAFVKIWKNIDSYDISKGRLFTWMLNVARNLAIDMLRSKSYRNEQQNRDIENNVSIENNLTTSTFVDHIGLSKVLSQLKEDYRTIIDLAYFKGFTQEEISKKLDIPLGTIKTRSRNALIELRAILNT